MAAPMMSAGEVVASLSEETGISKTDIRHILDELHNLAVSEIQQGHRFRLVNLVQVEGKIKPARKKRMGRNPRTGEDVPVPAKPASTAVKARVLKPGKDAVPTMAKLKKALA